MHPYAEMGYWLWHQHQLVNSLSAIIDRDDDWLGMEGDQRLPTTAGEVEKDAVPLGHSSALLSPASLVSIGF